MKPLRVMIVGNFLIRHWGKGRAGTDMRLAAGCIRNDWRVLEFSERDIVRLLAPFGFMRRIGAWMMNRRLLKTAKNFKPDIILVGHCDYTYNRTLVAIKKALPAVKIAHINVDPLFEEHCRFQIRERMDSCDAIFVTSAGDMLKDFTTGRNLVAFMPNPCDLAFENADNSTRGTYEYDFFFAGRSRSPERDRFVRTLRDRLDGKIKFGLFGMLGRPLIVGENYERALAASKMSPSLNREEGVKWYASDRLTHLMANGILAFQSAKSGYQQFFPDGECCVYFGDADDLAEKVLYYQAHEEKRRQIASAGRERYHRLFNSARVMRYIAETMLGMPYSEAYEWAKEVYR